MAFFELFDETLDINSTENYVLSVELSNYSVAYCILDNIRKKFIMLRSFEPEPGNKFTSDEIAEIIKKDDFLTKKYNNVNIVLPSAKFTLVPSPLFDPGRKDDYFQFNHLLPEETIVLGNKLSDPDSYVVFSLHTSLNQNIKSIWPEVFPFHHLKPLFNHIGSIRQNPEENYIHLHTEHDFFNLIYYEKNILKFCNSFNYRSISDILYYVMNVFKTMDINREESIHLSGFSDNQDDLAANLRQYIRNVKFAEPKGDFTFSYVFNEAGLHRFINLLSVVNCA